MSTEDEGSGDRKPKSFDQRLRHSVVNWRLAAGTFAALAAGGQAVDRHYVTAAIIVASYALGLWRSNRSLGSSTLGSWWGDDESER
jgi:hypothetical protein